METHADPNGRTLAGMWPDWLSYKHGVLNPTSRVSIEAERRGIDVELIVLGASREACERNRDRAREGNRLTRAEGSPHVHVALHFGGTTVFQHLEDGRWADVDPAVLEPEEGESWTPGWRWSTSDPSEPRQYGLPGDLRIERREARRTGRQGPEESEGEVNELHLALGIQSNVRQALEAVRAALPPARQSDAGALDALEAAESRLVEASTSTGADIERLLGIAGVDTE